MIPAYSSHEGERWMQLEYLPEDKEPDSEEVGPYDRT